MGRHHERFRWTVATQNPKDAREAKYNAENAAELNSYSALAIVDKLPHLRMINKLRDWEKDAVYNVVTPNRSGYGFTSTGLTLSSPEKHKVVKPSDDEKMALVNFGKPIGSLLGSRIVKVPSAEDFTGAIPVMDTEIPGEMFYYLPAQIEPQTMSKIYFEDSPSFVIMKDGEMPSYVFWRRKAEFAPSYTETELMEHWRSHRSGAPTAEPRPAPLAVNTDKTTEVVTKRQAQPEWEVFDPRLEENPIEFLDFYNTCLNGRHGVRSKLMLREVDIDRVNYISPCLAHNHKETAEEAVAATADAEAMDVDPVPTVSASKLPETSISQPPEAVTAKPWKQPGPIAADDLSWKQFFARQDRDKEIRGARIRPKAVFTSEYCNASGTKSDPKKAILTRELYDKYYHRAVTAHREIENRSKCCLACGLTWTLCPTTRYDHYKQHREEFKLHMKYYQKQQLLVEDPLRVENLDAAKAPMPKGVPEINWFRDLEQIILNMENELLEREQTCRICSAHVDVADESIADHYRKHAEERKQLRNIGAVINSVPHTPDMAVIVTPTGATFSSNSEQSPPARDYHGFQTTPEHIRQYEKEQAEKKKLAIANIANMMEASAQELRETGALQSNLLSPIPISSGSASSDPFVEYSNYIMDTSEDGPIYSDVIGNTTAPLALPPLIKSTAVPAVLEGDLDFLSGVSASKADSLDFLSEKDAQTAALLKPEAIESYRRFIEEELRNERQNRGLQLEPIIIGNDSDSSLGDSPASAPIEAQDDDTDLYSSPAPADLMMMEEGHFGQEDIVQAIRTNSGELLPLNDEAENSEDVEEVPEEFEVTSNLDVEEAPEDSEHIEADNGEDFDDSTSEDFLFHDDPLDVDQMVHAATHDLELNPEQLLLANEFVQEMARDSRPDQEKRSPRQQAWVRTMTRNLFPRHEPKKLDAAQLLVAKMLARATGHSNLRKMNLNLQQAFTAVDYADGLIHPVSGTQSNLPKQEIIATLIDYLFSFNKKVPTKGSRKAPLEPKEFSFEDAELNTNDLLNGIRLELYDIWRVLTRAKEAFEELVAANGKDSLSDIKYKIAKFTGRALFETWRHGYKDEPFALEPVVPIRHDGLDMDYKDLGVDDLLARAHDWGCNPNSVGNTAFKAWYLAVQLIKDQRALSMWDTPEFARAAIIHYVKRYVQGEIRKEKRWRKRHGLRIGQYASAESPTIDSAKWSTMAVGGRTPLNSPWTPVTPVTTSPTAEFTNSSEGNNKRKRPSPLPTPNKRKASDSSFHPGPPTPFNPDEVSPRMPKMPRKSNDPLYRPGSALLEPTTPPVTPKLCKQRSSTPKAADRAAKNVEKQLKKKQAKKAEEKQAKKVSLEATQASPSPESSASSTSSRTLSSQVVVTKKASDKSTSPAPAKNVASRASKSGVKKCVSKAKKSDSVSPAARPKRQAAIEVEKSFGKTKLVG